ncbi:MAG: transposase [Chitinophagales bacterium]|nr:transposase [Chitinophagales bacterium]MCZ2394069.1 transposase [Chitinophagales bacterium]
MAYKKHKQYRLFGYDYSQQGAYFITIVTKNRQRFFGEILNKEIHYSPVGEYVKQNLSNIKERIDYLYIDNWVIMPDHLHLIIVITNQKDDYTQITGLSPLNSKSISSFVNHLKGNIKRWCNANGFSEFSWQDRYHDRIIRDRGEFNRISQYIDNNILNWEKDDDNIN